MSSQTPHTITQMSSPRSRRRGGGTHSCTSHITHERTQHVHVHTHTHTHSHTCTVPHPGATPLACLAACLPRRLPASPLACLATCRPHCVPVRTPCPSPHRPPTALLVFTHASAAQTTSCCAARPPRLGRVRCWPRSRTSCARHCPACCAATSCSRSVLYPLYPCTCIP